MEILNQKERTKALGFFVLFFTLAVFVIILALVVNIYFPFKENNLLKQENARIQREMKFQDSFSFQLEKVKVAVDSIGTPKGGYKNDFFNEKLALSILADMYKQIPKDSLRNKNMYNNTILVYKELIDAKKQIKQLTINQKTLDSLSTINKTLKEEYDKMKVDLEVCKQLYQQE